MNSVLDQWNQAADAYWEEENRSQNVRQNRAIVEARFPDLSGWEVLDVGCGCGDYTDYFRRAGAHVIGCDGAPAMLELARKQFPEGTYELVNLLDRLPYKDGRFDLVFCNMVLMDLPELDELFGEFARVLKKGGTLYFSIVHPSGYPGEWVVDGQGIRIAKCVRNSGEIYQYTHQFCGGTTQFHRPVSFYFNLAAENGFRLVHMEEPIFNDEKGRAGIPLFLFAEFRGNL